MNKITTLNGAGRFSKNKQKSGKTVGLVVGSFDILHLGHTNLFSFAKKYTNFLIVGLDNDKTIKLVKGKNRPVNNFIRRSKLLSELETVDKIFIIEKALEAYENIVEKIRPTHLFIHKGCDRHWREKSKIAKKKGIKILFDRSKKITNSGTILDMISAEL